MNDVEKCYVVVSDYVSVNAGVDVSDAIQKIIDENPNRTLFFPDGEYLLAKPLATSANPERSVSLKLAAFAKLKAAEGWDSSEALVRLGGAEPFNTIYVPGSNYSLEGGIIDGSGVANGISIDSGRETCIHHVSIKNTYIGIEIKWGANNRSSDADIHNVNIVGNHKKGSIGIHTVGHDNTIANMRIAGVQTGLLLESGGNILRDVHPLYTMNGELQDVQTYLDSVAFDDRWDDNYYDICYSDQFCTAFSLVTSCRNIYDKSYIMWYSPKGNRETAFKVNGAFHSMVRSPRINFREDTQDNAVLRVSQSGGSGIIDMPMIRNIDSVTDETYKEYITDTRIQPKK